LQHLCQYCLVAHGCGIAIAIIALARCRPSMPRLAPVASLAATGLGVMIAIQVNAEPPKTYTIQEYVPVTYATASSEDIELRGIDEEDAFAPPVEDDDFLLPPGEDVGEDVVFAPPSEDVL